MNTFIKSSFSLFLAFLFCLPLTGRTQDGKKAKITFEKIQHNFGAIKEDLGIQTVPFYFKNEGSVPLILNNVLASCGCTTPEWTRQPIAPGAQGVIKVSYNPKNRPGMFSKTIRVSSNAENPEVVLTITGEVTPRSRTLEEDYPSLIGPLRAKTNYLSFPSVKVNQVKKDSTEVINTTDQAVQLSFRTPPAHISAVFHPAKIEPKQKGYLVITYDASKIKAYGFVANRLYLNIEGQDSQKALAVSANIDEDFSGLSAEDLKNAPVVNFDAESFDFGDIKQNTKNEHIFMLKNNGKKDLIIHDVKTSCGCTAVSPSKNVIPSGESVPLKVVFDSAGKLGKQLKTITVITNDPKKPTSILTIASNVLTQ